MECIDLSTQFRDWARGAAAMPLQARAHLESCSGCAVEWQGEQELAAAFSHLRAVSAGAAASPAVRAAVTCAYPAASIMRPAAASPRFDWRQFAALAALLAIAVAAGWRLSRPKAPFHPPRAARATQPLYTDFFPLSAVALDRHEAAQVIRIRLLRGDMRRFGLPVSEELERAPVEADVVIGQDGVARAIRFVSSSQ